MEPNLGRNVDLRNKKVPLFKYIGLVMFGSIRCKINKGGEALKISLCPINKSALTRMESELNNKEVDLRHHTGS